MSEEEEVMGNLMFVVVRRGGYVTGIIPTGRTLNNVEHKFRVLNPDSISDECGNER
jgi:hypothetical protein